MPIYATQYKPAGGPGSKPALLQQGAATSALYFWPNFEPSQTGLSDPISPTIEVDMIALVRDQPLSSHGPISVAHNSQLESTKKAQVPNTLTIWGNTKKLEKWLVLNSYKKVLCAQCWDKFYLQLLLCFGNQVDYGRVLLILSLLYRRFCLNSLLALRWHLLIGCVKTAFCPTTNEILLSKSDEIPWQCSTIDKQCLCPTM